MEINGGISREREAPLQDNSPEASVADPDLELKLEEGGGGEVVLLALPVFLSFVITSSFTQVMRAGPGRTPRSATELTTETGTSEALAPFQ